MRGFSDGEDGFVWVRGVEAGRAGVEDTEVALNGDVGVGAGNGFKFVDGSEFGLANGLPLSDANGLAFVAVGNGLDVCPETGNVLGVEKVFVPRKPFCENGLTPVGAGCRAPNGESPVACGTIMLLRKGFASVNCG